MLWCDKLKKWSSGIVQSYPKNIKNRFFFETFVCDKEMLNKYQEVFIESQSLNNLTQNYTPFLEHINNSQEKYVIVFNNLSGDTRLLIPKPIKNKDFTTIKDFIDNASETQQVHFWKQVALEIHDMLKHHDKIYVSTHGTGIYYLHLRLDTYPKYYHTQEFIK
jgi:hypothetical protein